MPIQAQMHAMNPMQQPMQNPNIMGSPAVINVLQQILGDSGQSTR